MPDWRSPSSIVRRKSQSTSTSRGCSVMNRTILQVFMRFVLATERDLRHSNSLPGN
jgi:hypothetical protein